MNECFPVPKSGDDGSTEWFVFAATPDDAVSAAMRASGYQSGAYSVSDPLDLEEKVILERFQH